MNQTVPTQPDPAATPLRLIDKKELRARVPYSEMTIWRLERDGRFPKRLHIGGKVFYVESEIEAWIAEHIAIRDQIAETEAQK